ENLAPSVVRRVAKELQALAQTPPEGIRVIVNETNLADIQAWITGPALNEEAGRLLLERYDDYAKHACLMTNIHAAIAPDLHLSTTTGVSGSDVSSVTPSLIDNVSPQELGASIPTQPKHSEMKKKTVDKKKKALKRL
ncbi:hypothetical protein IWQ61_008958, partial [Dispira simplex]